MKKVNLRDLYPDVYKSDHFVEVTEDVLETLRAAERAEAAYDRRMYRYKAHYSLDCDNGIENAILMKPQTPEMLLEEKQLREQLYAAVMALPEKQAKRPQSRSSRTSVQQAIIFAMAMSHATSNIKSFAHACMRRSFFIWCHRAKPVTEENRRFFEGSKANGWENGSKSPENQGFPGFCYI